MEEKPEVVIAGMAGTFPGCATVEDLQEALFKKSHLISEDKSNWEVCYDEDKIDWPMFTGHALSHDKFDATFFNIPFSYPSVMDPIMKKCLEISVEAVIDAGFNPKQLEGTNTAVYVTYDNSESELILTYTITEKVLMGNCRALTANRLSFAMNLQGPSYAFQGGYGSMLHYFDHAKRQLEEGRLDGAIIVSANNIMSPRFLAIYDGMGFSTADGKCRAFDEHAQGYAVSDSCAAFFLQRARDARRNWATVIGADFRFFGDKSDGNFISFHEEPVKKMLRENYEKWKIDPTTVTYIEADGCGFKEREDKEIDIIAETFCKNRKSPLLVGSVKSNMGHAETAAAAAGTVKAVIALNKSEIPPSINVETPNYKLAVNKMKVVTESTPLKGNLVGINAIGFAGGFGHLLLQQNVKSASSKKIEESLPQIMLMSSRTEEGIEQILQRVKTTNVTPEFATLSNGVFQENIKGHMFRGYNLKHADGTISEPKRQRVDGDKGPIWWVFSGMGSQWNGMGTELMHIPLFRDVIDKCDEILHPRGVDIKHILTTDDETIFDNILHSFVGIAAIQIGLVEILRTLEIEPEGIVGHSVGELGCAYADNCLTLEQTILAAHARGKASLEATLIKGMMAAVGLGFRDIVGMLPGTIDVACQNSSTSCTISGPTEDVKKFVAELEAKGIFAKSVNVANIAYHSRYIQPAGPILLKYLKEVIPINTKRSTKWVSSSVPKTNWFTNAAKFNSPEYHTNNLLSPVLFEEAITVIPENATLIEIAPHGLLQAILKRALPDTVANVPLTRRTKGPDPSNVKFLLDAIGKLYLLGYSPNVSLLYPPTQFPVPCDTPSLQPFVTWEHSETYKLPDYMQICGKEEKIVCEKTFSIPEIKALFRKHEEEDTPIHPISFLLVEVWKSFGAIHKKIYTETPVVFENIHIWSGLDLSKEDLCSVSISVLPVDGDFEIAQEWIGQGKNEDEEIRNMLISGRIKLWEDATDYPNSSDNFEKSNDDEICQSWQADDIERYYNNSGKAKLHLKSTSIHELELCSKGLKGKILWSGDWVLNFDTIIKANLLQGIKDAAQLDEPSSIQFIFISPDQTKLIEEGSQIEFCLDSSLRSLNCAGITVRNFKTQPTIELAGKEIVDTERLKFIPYSETSFSLQPEFLLTCLQIIFENAASCPSSDSNEFLRLNVVQMKPGRTVDPLISALEEVLQLPNNNIRIKLLITDPANCDQLDTSVCLSVLTDSNSIMHITTMNAIENVYLLTAFPKDTTLNSIMDVASVYKKEYVVLFEQVFDSQRFGLIKKVNSRQKLRVLPISEEWHASINTLKPSKNTEDEITLLIFNQPTSANPLFLQQEVLSAIGAHSARCFLLMDENAPAFSVDVPLYNEQIKRGMKVNILLNGQWGSFRSQPILSTLGPDFSRLLPLVDDASKEVDIHYVGLISVGEKRGNETKHYVMDYSGVKRCNGDQVIGIAHSSNQTEQEIILDPIFHWKIPQYLPLEDAVSLPHAYLMAHLIISDFNKHQHKKTVFIHNGQSSIGMACISVALDVGHEIYTTVPSTEDRETITRTFHQIPTHHITNHNDPDYYVTLMLETKGKGADVIVSDLSWEKMVTSWMCIAQYGNFINLNDEVTAVNSPLPMREFLKSASYLSFSLSDILRMSENRKRCLHKLVDEFLKSEQAIVLPHQIVAVEELQFRPQLLKSLENKSAKIVLSLHKQPTDNKNKSMESGHKHKITLCDPEQTYIVLSSNVENAARLITWLLDHSANKICLATMTQFCSSNAVKRINERLTKQNASVMMTSATQVQSMSGAQNLIERASMMGNIAAVFTVALDMNVNVIRNIQEARHLLHQSCPVFNIQAEHIESCPENTVSILCDNNLDYTHVLTHAFTNPGRSAVYVVKKKTKTKRRKEETDTKVDQITNYLPTTITELTEIGKRLSTLDAGCPDEMCAIFLPSTSLAPRRKGYKEVRPVFLIPAFCENQLRPLISRLMYPCFVAHVHHRAPSINQIALNLLKSMMEIQKRGPFTIVAETWSGGIAMLLSTLLSNAGHGVSVFLLQGVPARLHPMLPEEDALTEFLITTMLKINKTDNKQAFKHFNESQILESALNLLSLNGSRSYAARAFTTVKKSMEFLRAFTKMNVQVKDVLVLFELEETFQSITGEIESLSTKKPEVIKSRSKSYKEMLIDPLVASTISEEAPFSWDLY